MENLGDGARESEVIELVKKHSSPKKDHFDEDDEEIE